MFSVSIDPKFYFFDQIKFPRGKNSFIRNKRYVLVVSLGVESSSSDYEVNMRVSIKLSSKGVNDGKDSRSDFIFLFEEIENSLSSYFGKKRKSGTMSSKESTKFFRNSKGKMKIMKVSRSSRDEIRKPKIRSRSSTRVAKAILTRKRDLFDSITIIAFEGSKSELRIRTRKYFINRFMADRSCFIAIKFNKR